MTALASIEAQVLDRIEADAMLAQVERWAAVNSGSRNLAGLATMAGLLADAAAALPGDVRLIDPASSTQMDASGRVSEVEHGRILIVQVRPAAERRLLFTGHMDTVFAADHPFQSARRLHDGTINGPGVADMKGGLGVMLAALVAIEQAGAATAIGYDVLINADEEVGSPGSAALIEQHARGKLAALTYEPALPDGTLAGARPGSGNLSLAVRGRAAHAGRNPEDGRNAIVAAADLALRLFAGRGAGLSVNPARIEGGAPNNMVPDNAVLRVNLRPSGADDLARARSLLDESVAAVERTHDVTIGRHGGFARPPKPLDARALRLFDLVRNCGAGLGISVAWRATGGVCDGNNIAATGLPVIDTMGVRGGAIHTEEEYLIPESLGERARLSALTILRIADGALA